jgi:predicted nucleic acid-binding protein
VIVVDTGRLVAMANEQDRHHARCVEWFETAPGPLLLPAPILTEVCYLLERERGAAVEAAFLRSVRDEIFTLVAITREDLDRMAELVETYSSLPLGAADASVIAVAERLKLAEVATLDRRHFTVVRPNHVDAPTLLP